MIKDPLQPDETPFELLGLSSLEAGDKEIKAAFNQRLRGAGKRLGQIKQARETLLRNPQERAVLGLFFYDPQIAAKLQPSPVENPEALEPEQRAATAKAWAHQFKRTFPGVAMAHALAILWYWNAVAAQTEVEAALAAGGDAGEAGRAALRSWRRACAYWVMVVATPAFWNTREAIPEELRPEVKERLVETRLRHRIQDMMQRCRDGGAAEPADGYQALLQELSTELETAEQFARTGIGVKGRPVCCGPMLLEQFGLTERFRAQVAQALVKKPDNPRLKAIQAALSPHTHLAVLLKEGRFEALLAAVEALPEAERGQPEVAALAMEARLGLGDQQAEMDRFEAALEQWKKATEEARSAGLSEPAGLRERVVKLSERATVVLARDPGKAIAVLELVCALVDERELRLKLGALLNQRGGSTFMEGFKPWQGGDRSEKNMERMRKGLAKLERAEALGDPGAKQQAADARDVMIRLGEHPGLSANAKRLLADADRQAGKQKWDMACAYLLVALGEVGAEQRRAVEKWLAEMLKTYAVEKFNATGQRKVTDVQGLQSLHQEQYEAWLDLKYAAELDGSNANIIQNFSGVSQQLKEFVEQLGRTNPQALALVQTAQGNAERARRERLEKWKRLGRTRLKGKGGEESADTTGEAGESKPEETAFGVAELVVMAGVGGAGILLDWHWIAVVLVALLAGGAVSKIREELAKDGGAKMFEALALGIGALFWLGVAGYFGWFDSEPEPPPSAAQTDIHRTTTRSGGREVEAYRRQPDHIASTEEKRRLTQPPRKRAAELVAEARSRVDTGSVEEALDLLAEAREIQPDNARAEELLTEIIVLKVTKARLLGAEGRHTEAESVLGYARHMARRFGLGAALIDRAESDLALRKIRQAGIVPAHVTDSRARAPAREAAEYTLATARRHPPEPPVSSPDASAGNQATIGGADPSAYLGQQVVIEKTDGRRYRGQLFDLQEKWLVLKRRVSLFGNTHWVQEQIEISSIDTIRPEPK